MNKAPPRGILCREGVCYVEYPVMLGKERVGTVDVTKSGLYARFSCRCKLSGEVICALEMRCGAQTEKLGILVPEGKHFALDTKVPLKRIGAGEMVFRIVPRHSERSGQFVPIYPDEPFAYISRLKDAFLERRDGIVGARIPQEPL